MLIFKGSDGVKMDMTNEKERLSKKETRTQNSYSYALANQSIWLFLATLGSWSVTNLLLRLFALLVVVFIFAGRMTCAKDQPQTTAENKDNWMMLQKKYLFKVCWVFYGCTLVYTFVLLAQRYA